MVYLKNMADLYFNPTLQTPDMRKMYAHVHLCMDEYHTVRRVGTNN